jgi:hypothetical protein
VVLNPVSAINTSADVLSSTPAALPERIWLFPIENAAFPERSTWPNTSAEVRNAAPPEALMAGELGAVGQKVLFRPCTEPAVITTGMAVPPPTMRKLTLSTKTPEPAPVALTTSERPEPVAYATLSERYNCVKLEPLTVMASVFAGALTSMPLMLTTPGEDKTIEPLMAVAKDLPAEADCRLMPPMRVMFSL